MVLEQAFSRTTLPQVGIFESNSESRASGFLAFRQCCDGVGVIEPCAYGYYDG
jgi:hypothetical protein